MEIIFRVHYVCFYFLVYARTIVGASNANEACRLQLQRMIHSHTFPNPASWLLSLRCGFDSILDAGAPCIAFHVQPQSLYLGEALQQFELACCLSLITQSTALKMSQPAIFPSKT
jgi:hypothetical protein